MTHPLGPQVPRTTAPTASDSPVLMHRMNREQYVAFEAALKHTPLVDDSTSVLTAGFKLGVEHALRVLREGFVIEAR